MLEHCGSDTLSHYPRGTELFIYPPTSKQLDADLLIFRIH